MVPQVHCYMWSLALQPFHAPTPKPWDLLPAGTLLLDAAPPHAWPTLGHRRPECPDHGQAAAPTYFPPPLGLLEDSKGQREPQGKSAQDTLWGYGWQNWLCLAA